MEATSMKVRGGFADEDVDDSDDAAVEDVMEKPVDEGASFCRVCQ